MDLSLWIQSVNDALDLIQFIGTDGIGFVDQDDIRELDLIRE